jgi:hypothetical protein
MTNVLITQSMMLTGGGYYPNGNVSITCTVSDGSRSVFTGTASSTGTLSMTIPLASVTDILVTTSLTIFATDLTTNKASNTVSASMSFGWGPLQDPIGITSYSTRTTNSWSGGQALSYSANDSLTVSLTYVPSNGQEATVNLYGSIDGVNYVLLHGLGGFWNLPNTQNTNGSATISITQIATALGLPPSYFTAWQAPPPVNNNTFVNWLDLMLVDMTNNIRSAVFQVAMVK